jgi:hypothetical protein
MKKSGVILGILAATIIAVVVLNFCTKTDIGNNAHSVKVRKVPPYCQPPSQVVQLTLQSVPTITINLCIDCNSISNGAIEACFSIDGLQPCDPYPYGTCCPFPLLMEYIGPSPATPSLLHDPNNWRWTGGTSNLPPNVNPSDLLQIVADPAFAFCF